VKRRVYQLSIFALDLFLTPVSFSAKRHQKLNATLINVKLGIERTDNFQDETVNIMVSE